MYLASSESDEDGVMHEVDESVASDWADVASFKATSDSMVSYHPSRNESMVRLSPSTTSFTIANSQIID